MLSAAAYTPATITLRTGKYVGATLIVLAVHCYLCSDAMRTRLSIEPALAIVVDTNLCAYVLAASAHNVYAKLVMSIIANIAMWLLVAGVVGWFVYDRTNSKTRRRRTSPCTVTRLPKRHAG